MSLISYSSRDQREIVLRHKNAIVLRDPQTQQLILRGTNSSSHCPTCHQLIRGSSPERPESPQLSSTFISSKYFRLLQALNDTVDENNSSSNSVRRLVEPAFNPTVHCTGSSASTSDSCSDSSFQKSSYSIKKESFSQGYFEKFFNVEKELGRGGKGVVLLVRHELDSVSLGQFACKKVPVGDDHTWLEKVLVEVQLLQELSHPNLVSYRHVWLENAQMNRFGPIVPCAFILQQYCNSGDLLHYVMGSRPRLKSAKEKMKDKIRRKPLSQAQDKISDVYNRKLGFDEIYSFFKDITSGIAHLHASNYIHRDLKPSNCLLHQEGKEMRCLISDFGEVQAENMVRKSTGSTGTISYCAPEVLKQDSSGRYGNFTTKSDIFSLGMILYYMCFSRLPYKSADSIEEEYEDIRLLRDEISSWTGFRDERRERPDLPDQLYDFLKRLLAIKPEERPSASDILTAIRTEKGFGDPSRSRHSSNASLGSRFLQPLDSTMPLVNTVNDSVERDRSATYIEDEAVSETEYPDFDESSNFIVKPSNARESSLNKTRQPSPSPPEVKPPLLMPPPSTPFSKLRNMILIIKHQTHECIKFSTRAPGLGFKLLVYMAKLWSLTTPCKPRLAKSSIWWPLVLLAALELAVGDRGSWNMVTWMASVHFFILCLTVWWYGSVDRGLCDWEKNDFWN